MDQYVILLQLTVRAFDADTAHDFGMDFADHLLETSDFRHEIEGHRIEVKTSRIGDKWSDNDRESVQTKQHWLAGTNAPGYLPDNAPEIFDDFDMAKSYIMSEIDADIDLLASVAVKDQVDKDAIQRSIGHLTKSKKWVEDCLAAPFSQTVEGRCYFVQRAEE